MESEKCVSPFESDYDDTFDDADVSYEKMLKAEKGLKYDENKLRYDLIPPIAMRELAKILTYGCKKYTADSWQQVTPFESRYTAALFRHIEAWRMGETLDPESGLHHLSHALCNVAFLLWKEFEDAPTCN